MTIPAKQRERLTALANYLDTLPLSYRHFEMSDFLGLFPWDPVAVKYALHNGGLDKCNTVACALGHGPAAGILVPESCISRWDDEEADGAEVDWYAYSRLFDGGDGDLEVWLFGGNWSAIDNTHRGAAARIRYALEHGVPPDFVLPEMAHLGLYASYVNREEGPANAPL